MVSTKLKCVQMWVSKDSGFPLNLRVGIAWWFSSSFSITNSDTDTQRSPA